MRTLFNWYIARRPVDTVQNIKLENHDYIGKPKCFYVVRGSLTKKIGSFSGDPIRTSALKKVEFIEDDACMRVYTQDFLYDCPLKECRKDKQEPFEILPDSVKEIAEAKLRPIIFAPSEPNSIILAFDNNDRNSNFFDAAFNRDGKTSRLYTFSFKDYGHDDLILSDNAVWPQKIDIRYGPVVNRQGRFIEFRKFNTDGLDTYLFNAGDKPLSFLTFNGFIDLEPLEQKKVAKENVASDSKEKIIRWL